MPNATAMLAFFSFAVVAQGQNTKIIWPESESQDTRASQPKETYDTHVDEDGMDVVEVYGGDVHASSSSLPTSPPTEISTGGDKMPEPFFDGLDDEDSATEEMDDLIGRMESFRTRVEKAQTSKSEEAINARFFAGLDDDDEEEGEDDDGRVGLKLSGEQIIEMLATGKLPANLQKLLATEPSGPSAEANVDIDGPAAPRKEPVLKDPPAVITTYHDQVDSLRTKEGNPIVLLSRFNFQSNVMTRRDDEVENWIIRFCHDWYSPCERMLPAYKTLARETEKELNQDSMRTVVRFAEVDCSTDKPLCNEQGAETFPKLIHYHKGVQIGEWEGASGKDKDVEEMNSWMKGQSKKILEQSSQGLEMSTKAKSDSLITKSLKTWDASWLFSLVVMIAALLGHVWLVRARTYGSSPKALAKESHEDSKQPAKHVKVPTNGPSGLGSMLPEEWVSKSSGKDLIEL